MIRVSFFFKFCQVCLGIGSKQKVLKETTPFETFRKTDLDIYMKCTSFAGGMFGIFEEDLVIKYGVSTFIVSLSVSQQNAMLMIGLLEILFQFGVIIIILQKIRILYKVIRDVLYVCDTRFTTVPYYLK